MTSIPSMPPPRLRSVAHETASSPPAMPRSNGPSGPTLTNWNGVVSFTPREVKRPSTVEELMEIVRTSDRVRVAGAMHSMNGGFVADSNTTLISTKHLNAISAPITDSSGTSVWVQAGAKIADINATLAAQGFALASLPTSEKITIAGAVANGVHGSGLKAPAVLAEQVLGIQLVDSDGKLVDVSQEDLPFARISLGSLGAVSALKLRVVPAFELLSSEDITTRDALQPDRIRAALAEHDHAMYIFDPKRETVVRRFLSRVGPTNQGLANSATRKTDYEATGSIRAHLEHLALNAAKFLGLEDAASGILLTAHKARPQRVGASHLMFQENFNHPSRDMSFGVPLEKTADAVADIKKSFDEIGYHANVPIAIRFLKGTDATHLAMNSGRDTAVIEFVSLVEFDNNKKAQDAFEKVMLKHGARPHWAKEFSGSPKEAYPKEAWDRFAALHQRWGSKFGNAWAERVTPAGEPAPAPKLAATDAFEKKPRTF